jgi:hypothetical protein
MLGGRLPTNTLGFADTLELTRTGGVAAAAAAADGIDAASCFLGG